MNKRIVWGFMSAVMFISAGILVFYFFWANGYIDPPETPPTASYSEFTYPSMPSEIVLTPTPVDVSESYSHKVDYDRSGGIFANPVNFDELHAVNSDIIGWLYMTTPYISQPILRSGSSDSFYLQHDATGEYARAGSLYVEGSYNGTDFNDMCTVIYGHRMSDGSMFGSLQASIEDVDLTADPQYIVIYLPDSVKIYQICATIPRDKMHILHYNNFDNESDYNRFINQVYGASGEEVDLVEDIRPEYGDRLLILSTCLRRDRTHRFLVIAKELT